MKSKRRCYADGNQLRGDTRISTNASFNDYTVTVNENGGPRYLQGVRQDDYETSVRQYDALIARVKRRRRR